MTLSEQAAVLLRAANNELLHTEDIVRWADAVIAEMEKPPDWIVDLSTSNSPHMADFITRRRERAPVRPPQ